MAAPICPTCNKRPRERKAYLAKHGIQRFRRRCAKCRLRPHVQYKKNHCEFCGFVPEHIIQLDVDHIDGNHKNNNPSNLQTLCANCHRLKTINNGDNPNYEKVII